MPPRRPTSLPAVLRIARRALHRTLTVVGAPAVSEFRDLEVEGLDNVPAVGPALIACNHRSAFDAATVQAVLDRPATVVALQGWWPSPEGDESVLVQRRVAAGDLLLAFPEVQPSPDGLVHRGHIGLGALLLDHDLPVIPAAVVNHGRSVRFGAPLDFSRHGGLPLARTLARSVTDEVMEHIVDLSDQDYSDATAAGARQQARRDRREQIVGRRIAAAARRRALKMAEVTRREQRHLERSDLARRAEEAEIVARRQAEEAALRDRQQFGEGR
jgi:1-acyl-sn-glycerol-3-phosphate acyltransferase